HRTTGDDAGTDRCSPHHDTTRAEMAQHVVMERATLAQMHTDHALARPLSGLADRLRDLTRLAGAEADPTLAVAGDDQSGEAEPATTLHHLRDPVNRNELFYEFRLFAAFAFTLAPWTSCHASAFLERQSALARGIGQSLDPAVKAVTTAVEHDFLDAGSKGALRHKLADLGRRSLVGPGLALLTQGLLQSRRCSHSHAALIVDDLRIYVSARPEDRQPRPASLLAAQRQADTPLAPLVQFSTRQHSAAPTSSCLPYGGFFRPRT